MIDAFLENSSQALALTGIIGAVIALIFSFTQFRRSRYLENVHRIELDHSRKVMEREVERLHEQIYRDNSRLAELNHLLIDSLRAQPQSVSGKILGVGLAGSIFLKSMGIAAEDIEIDHQLVFVLTPLNSSQAKVFQAIQEECNSVGLTARRGDETKIDGPILPHIVKEIVRSRIIVANINGRNPNVFYELGIAQALGKQVILVVKTYDDVPFDLKQQQLVIYENIEELRGKFKNALSRYALQMK